MEAASPGEVVFRVDAEETATEHGEFLPRLDDDGSATLAVRHQGLGAIDDRALREHAINRIGPNSAGVDVHAPPAPNRESSDFDAIFAAVDMVDKDQAPPTEDDMRPYLADDEMQVTPRSRAVITREYNDVACGCMGSWSDDAESNETAEETATAQYLKSALAYFNINCGLGQHRDDDDVPDIPIT